MGERARTVAALSEASCSPSVAAAFLVLRAVLASCTVPDSAPCAAVLGAFCMQSACQQPPVIILLLMNTFIESAHAKHSDLGVHSCASYMIYSAWVSGKPPLLLAGAD